jgi:hypothetical protein
MPRAEEEAVRQDRELIRVSPALRYFAVGPRHNADKLSTCPATCSSAAGASSSDVVPKAVTQVAMRFEDRHSFLVPNARAPIDCEAISVLHPPVSLVPSVRSFRWSGSLRPVSPPAAPPRRAMNSRRFIRSPRRRGRAASAARRGRAPWRYLG